MIQLPSLSVTHLSPNEAIHHKPEQQTKAGPRSKRAATHANERCPATHSERIAVAEPGTTTLVGPLGWLLMARALAETRPSRFLGYHAITLEPKTHGNAVPS